MGSPGWEGHADKKRKRNHIFFLFFFLTCVMYSDESFLPTAPFPGIGADAQASPSGSPINKQCGSNVLVTIHTSGEG